MERRPRPLPSGLLPSLLIGIGVGGGVGRGITAADVSLGRRIHFLPQICNPAHRVDGAPQLQSNAETAIASAVEAGELSRARHIAYECILLHQVNLVDELHTHCCPSSSDEVVGAYQQSMDGFFRGHDDFLDLIANEGADGDEIGGILAPTECWDGRDASPASNVVTLNSFGSDGVATDIGSPGSAAIERWNECCSFFRPNYKSPCFGDNNRYLCCEVAEGSDNHLILPALREPSVDIRLSFNDDRYQEVIRIEQEGSLRMFDVAGVLWPAGYLLGMCLADPISCGVSEVMDAVDGARKNGQPLAIELGAGVGFPSVAFAKAIRHRNSSTETSICEEGDKTPVVVATDISNASLALIASNAYMNGVGNLVAAMEANHTNATSLTTLSHRVAGEGNGGFDVVIGSSLQALFDGTSQQSAALWQSLDALLSKNPNAVAVLSHVRTGGEKIALPPELGRIFECVRRVSGDRFGMKTRDGNTSDFEIVLLKRRHT